LTTSHSLYCGANAKKSTYVYYILGRDPNTRIV
jgi:hypothetical protein